MIFKQDRHLNQLVFDDKKAMWQYAKEWAISQKRKMQANGHCGQSYVEACEPEDNPTHAQGRMGRLFNREPGEVGRTALVLANKRFSTPKVGRKATKRKGPYYNRALAITYIFREMFFGI